MPLIAHGHLWTAIAGGWRCERDTCSASVSDAEMASNANASTTNYNVSTDFVDAVSAAVNGV